VLKHPIVVTANIYNTENRREICFDLNKLDNLRLVKMVHFVEHSVLIADYCLKKVAQKTARMQLWKNFQSDSNFFDNPSI